MEREDLELECEVYGRPEPVIRWLKNGEVITPNNHDMALVNGYESLTRFFLYFNTKNIIYIIFIRYNLRIQGLMAVDSGMFQCVASNPAGNIQAAAQLTVLSGGNILI